MSRWCLWRIVMEPLIPPTPKPYCHLYTYGVGTIYMCVVLLSLWIGLQRIISPFAGLRSGTFGDVKMSFTSWESCWFMSLPQQAFYLQLDVVRHPWFLLRRFCCALIVHSGDIFCAIYLMSQCITVYLLYNFMPAATIHLDIFGRRSTRIHVNMSNVKHMLWTCFLCDCGPFLSCSWDQVWSPGFPHGISCQKHDAFSLFTIPF